MEVVDAARWQPFLVCVVLKYMSREFGSVVPSNTAPVAVAAGRQPDMAEAMSSVVTAAVGYDVRVKAKWCEEVGAIVWAD